jgi:hypothetical protein
MSLIDTLRERFPTKYFSDKGLCIVVPTAEFRSDWEGRVHDEGRAFENTEYKGQKVTLVVLSKNVSKGGAEGVQKVRFGRWSNADINTLRKRMSQLKSVSDEQKCFSMLAEEFRRTPEQVKGKWDQIKPKAAKPEEVHKEKGEPPRGVPKVPIISALFTEKEKASLLMIVGYALGTGICEHVPAHDVLNIMKKVEEMPTADSQ